MKIITRLSDEEVQSFIEADDVPIRQFIRDVHAAGFEAGRLWQIGYNQELSTELSGERRISKSGGRSDN